MLTLFECPSVSLHSRPGSGGNLLPFLLAAHPFCCQEKKEAAFIFNDAATQMPRETCP